ncbi:hypothetical protein ACLKA6_003001 [Drosophila palustris]
MVNHRNASSPGASRTPVKPEILSLLRRKRELRRRWMSTRHPLDKAEFNAATNLLRKALFEAKSDYFVDKLRAIDPNQNRGFALWKCTRSLKRQPMRRFSLLRRDGTWARSDLDIAEEFANDLCERFTPFDLATDEEVLVTTTFSGVNPGPIAHISPIIAPEVVEQVKRLKPNKAPGHDALAGGLRRLLCKSSLMNMSAGRRDGTLLLTGKKSQHATFSLNRGNTTQISLNGTRIQHRPEVKYLGIIIDRRLTWKPHILRTCATVRAKCKKLDWLLRPRSGLSLTAKVRLFKAIISPTLTWGLNIWGTACNSSIKKIESCQSKILRRIVGSPWYVRDVTIYRDLANECKSAWASLRDSLRYHRSKLAKSGSAGGIALGQPRLKKNLDWQFAEHMAFLPVMSLERRTKTSTTMFLDSPVGSPDAYSSPFPHATEENQMTASSEPNWVPIDDDIASTSSAYSYQSRASKRSKVKEPAADDEITGLLGQYLKNKQSTRPIFPFWDKLLSKLPEEIATATEVEITNFLFAKVQLHGNQQ